jgi:hypothetical protein
LLNCDHHPKIGFEITNWKESTKNRWRWKPHIQGCFKHTRYKGDQIHCGYHSPILCWVNPDMKIACVWKYAILPSYGMFRFQINQVIYVKMVLHQPMDMWKMPASGSTHILWRPTQKPRLRSLLFHRHKPR